MLRVFELKTGKILRTFQTGRQIAAGPTIFSAGGKEYVAITVGGTPTSSGGGLASQLQVFTLGGGQASRPGRRGFRRVDSSDTQRSLAGTAPPTVRAGPRRRPRRAACDIAISGGALPLTLWDPDSSNLRDVTGRLTLRGEPVAARAHRGRPLRPSAGDGSGRRIRRLSSTRRSPGGTSVGVVDATRATIAGQAADAGERPVTVACCVGRHQRRVSRHRYPDASRVEGGAVRIAGRLIRSDGAPPPPVVLLSYRLDGSITDAVGQAGRRRVRRLSHE